MVISSRKDSDYHTAVEQNERYTQAHEYGINLHIWQRKEIENYLLDPTVIARSITPRQGKPRPTTADVQVFPLRACDEEKDTVLDAIATTIFRLVQRGAQPIRNQAGGLQPEPPAPRA